MHVLNREIEEFENRNPDPKAENFDPKTGRYTLAIEFGEEPDAERWGILLGDVIHNLRSALDHVIWQLVLLNEAKPRPTNQWPMSRSAKKYIQPRKDGRASVREECLFGVSEPARTVIDGYQPHIEAARMNEHFLSVLAALSNADKHRLIQAGFLGIQEFPKGFLATQDVGTVLESNFIEGPLEKGAYVVDCTLAITGPDPQVKMHRNLALVVGFGEQCFARNAIGEMMAMVGTAIERFQPFFDGK